MSFTQHSEEQGRNGYSNWQGGHNITGEEGRGQWDLIPKENRFKNAKADITWSSFQGHSQRHRSADQWNKDRGD